MGKADVRMKQCTKCKKWKDLREFSKQSSRKDGLRSWCKKCECEYAHNYYGRKKKRMRKHTISELSHRLVNGAKEKRCCRCKKWKAETEFYKQRRLKDGLMVYCKECTDKATNDARRRRRLAVRN